jgi:hypothetical protein
MALSRDELNGLVEKLRARYDEYARKFSSAWFNRPAFEDRFKMAIKNNMDLEAFILAEVANFETIRERYEKKKTQQESFSKKIDKVIDDNNARILKYPEIDFHSSAGIEIKRMYGALSEYAQFKIPVLWLIFSDYHRRNKITELEHRFQRYALPRGNRPPTAIEDHILLLNRAGVTEIEIEKSRNNYLKECAFLLHDVEDFCGGFIVERLTDLDMPVSFDKAFFTPEVNKKVAEEFSDCTGYGALLRLKENAEAILDDFRLTAFKSSR